MRRIRSFALALAFGAWALPAAAQQKPNDNIHDRLAKELAANPGSGAANRALGLWYYKADRFAEARVPLEQARRIDPKDGVSALYAGLSAERTKDFAAAKEAYNSYLAVGRTKSVRDDIRARLVTITKAEARASAKDAIAREAQVAQVAGSPTTVAVLPFTIGGTDARLQPLQLGLADLVISDLAKPKKLTVVERDKIQALADELALGKSGQVDAATAVHAGRLIQAGRIVQGSLISTGANAITMTSTVMNTQDTAVVGRGMNASNTLDQLFNLEKRLVLATFADLGITLSPAERQDVDRRPTQSLAAFLSYSRGLAAEDAGRLDEAARLFESAHAIDPGFGAALDRAKSASAQSQQSTTKIESHLTNSDEGRTVKSDLGGNRSPGSTTNTLNTVVGDVNPTTTNTVATYPSTVPSTRPASANATGTDRPAPRTGQATIVIGKP
jgi:tetratricopeptide (TPR) repeat protein